MFEVQAGDLSKEHSILLPNLILVVVDVLEELRIVFQLVLDVADNDDAEVLPFSFTPERITHKLEGDVLQNWVEQSILDNGTEEFGDLFQILGWILVQEAVLIEKTMQHARVDLLLLNDLRLFEPFHLLDQMVDSRVHFGCRTLEDLLEIFISSAINFLVSVLSRLVCLWEKDGIPED